MTFPAAGVHAVGEAFVITGWDLAAALAGILLVLVIALVLRSNLRRDDDPDRQS